MNSLDELYETYVTNMAPLTRDEMLEIKREYNRSYYRENPEICRRAITRWENNNKERMKEYRREYNRWYMSLDENREKFNNARVEAYRNNTNGARDKVLQYQKENQERISEQKREYYQRNKERIKNQQRNKYVPVKERPGYIPLAERNKRKREAQKVQNK